MRDYSRRWCDDVILALGNRRPRTLVKTEAGRAKVRALLEEFERTPGPPGAGGLDCPLIRRNSACHRPADRRNGPTDNPPVGRHLSAPLIKNHSEEYKDALESPERSSWATRSTSGFEDAEATETAESLETTQPSPSTQSRLPHPGSSITGETGKLTMGAEPPTRSVGTRFMLAVQTNDSPQPTRPPAGWLVALRGSQESFAVLDKLPASETVRVVHDGESHFLTGSQINSSKDAITAHSRAESLLETLNGLAAVVDRRYKPVSLASPVLRLSADGTRTWSGSFVGGVIYDGNTPFSWKTKSVPEATSKWIDLAIADPKVRDALALFASGPRDWSTLYRIFEIIAGDLASRQHAAELKIVAMSWATRAEIRLFRQSAIPERHAKSRTRLPEQPMNIPDAEGFIRNLLARWISRKTPVADH